MIKAQKGLSALVIVIIVAVMVALLLVITFLFLQDRVKTDSELTIDPEVKLDSGPDTADIERAIEQAQALIPLESLPPEWLEWLDEERPGFIEHYQLIGGITEDLYLELEQAIMSKEGEDN